MMQRIFTVYDNKADAFLPPFFQHTEAMAMRVFSDACRQDDHPFCRNPSDYSLFTIGIFDDATGVVTPLSEIKLLTEAAIIVAQVANIRSGNDPQVDLEEVANG